MAKQAVDAKRTNLFLMDPDELHIAGPGEPHYDPREEYDIEESDVESVMEFGIIQPIRATKMGDQMFVVAGRQRVKWARIAKSRGWEGAVPTYMARADKARSLGMCIVENEHRVADDAITRAGKMAAYLDEVGDMRRLEVAFKCSESTIKNFMRLLELAPEIQADVKSGAVSPHAALKLHGLPLDEQVKALAEAKETGSVTGDAMDTRARSAKAANKNGGTKPASDEPVAVKAPGMLFMRRLIDAESTSDEVRYVLRFLAGQVTERTAKSHVPWLGAAVKEAQGDKRSKT